MAAFLKAKKTADALRPPSADAQVSERPGSQHLAAGRASGPALAGLGKRAPPAGRRTVPAPAAPPRPRRSTVWRVATPLGGVLSGALFVARAHSSEGTGLRPGRFTALASMVRSDADQVDALKKKVADLNEQVTALSGAVDNKQFAQLNRQAERMRGPAGLLPQAGPGVTVTLSDAPPG